jgi:hypothetical protein
LAICRVERAHGRLDEAAYEVRVILDRIVVVVDLQPDRIYAKGRVAEIKERCALARQGDPVVVETGRRIPFGVPGGRALVRGRAASRASEKRRPSAACTALRAAYLVRLTPRTIVARASLVRCLGEIRRRCLALADEEAETGVVAIAVAIPGSGSGTPVPGTLSTAGPAARMPAARHAVFAASLGAAAQDIARFWGAPDGRAAGSLAETG